jgi:hypothetical protein
MHSTANPEVFEWVSGMTRSSRVLRIAWSVLAAATLFGTACDAAGVQDGRPVNLALVFNAEKQPVRTTACLQVTERVYPSSRWWLAPTGSAGASEGALKAVLEAIRRKDRAALYQLSHPTLGRDPKRFDEQAQAYFQQLSALELVAVPRAYVFDGFTVFSGDFQFNKQTFFAPLVFAAEDNGSLGFLPYRTDAVTYRLVEQWFGTSGSPAGPGGPAYCSDADTKRATHRISLGLPPAGVRPPQHPSVLLLRGASFDQPGDLRGLVARLRSTIASLKSAVASGTIDDIAAHLTPQGARRLKEWYLTADQLDRQRYEKTIVEQEPFFVFDMSSVAAVYTKSPSGVQVMYFTIGGIDKSLWVNSSYAALADSIFKKGPLYDAARQALPFGSIAIK